MKILYLGTVCELTEYEKILSVCKHKPTVATVVFENALLSGMYKNDADVTVFSYPMIPTVVDSKRLYWGNKHEKLPCGYTCTWLKTLNIPVFKQLSRKLDARRKIKNWIRENAGEDCIVLSYGIAPFLAKDIVSLCRKNKITSCAIVPDLPRDMYINSKKKSIVSWLKNQYLKFALKSQSEFDSYVYLTEAMSEVVAPQKPYIVMEGLLDTAEGVSQKHIKSNPRGIMYAGGLNEKYGIINLLDAFENANPPDAELWLFGNGNAVSTIEARAKVNPKIRLYGRKTRDEILSYEKKATLLVNPRSVKDEFTRYSFPSKIMEYMSSGTPVLMTKLQGIPGEYFDYAFGVDDNEPDQLAKAIESILLMPGDELENIGIRARRFIEENKNSVVQTSRILAFLSKIKGSSYEK